MRRALLALAVAALLLLGLVPSALAEEQLNIAIMKFEDVKVDHWWSGSWDVGDQFTVLVTDGIVNKGKFNVMERARIDEIMAEQNFQSGDAVDESTAVQLGKLLGVRVVVLGSVTDFSMKGASGISVGGFGLGLQKGSVQLSARVVDVETGRILASAKGEGSASGASFDAHLSGISFNTEKFQNTTLGKASTKAVSQLVTDLAKKIEENSAKITAAAAAPKLTGKVMAVLGPNQVVIDLGKNRGVKKGQVFQIFRMQMIQGLSAPVRIPVGALKITSVDNEASVCEVTQTQQPVQAGDALEQN